MYQNIMATVVNVKVAHIRPTYNDLEHWMQNPNNVYIGRRGIVFINERRFPERDSIWANPFKVRNMTRQQAIDQYREYIIGKLNSGEIPMTELQALIGKNLGCWCVPEMCHGHVLVDLIKYAQNMGWI